MPLRSILLCLLLLVSRLAWAEGVIHLVLSEAGAAHEMAAESFRAELGARSQTRVYMLDEVSPPQIQALTRGNDLIVPIGVKAARFVAEHHAGQAAVLSLMVPRAVGERLPWPASLPRRKTSFVFIDQPAARMLGLVAEAFPNASRVGLVISQENAGMAKPLAQEIARKRLSLNLEIVDSPENVAPALRRVLVDSDVLLLIPDTLVINAANAQNVLLTTYRHRVPVVGFSQGLAKAGAVASVYSSPAQIGRQGARLALHWLDEMDFPAGQPAAEFSLSFNEHVARSLGLALPDAKEIRRKLGAVE